MNVLYINACFWGGGAEKVSRQLYYGLKEYNINTFYLAGRYQKNLPQDIGVIYQGFLERAVSALLGIMNHNFLFKTFLARKKIINIIRREKIDIVHFHNLRGNYIGLTDLKAIRRFCPKIVITMHDMWLLTGCCPYGMNCNEWENNKRCVNCHGNEWMKKGTSRARMYLKCKAESISKMGYDFVSPSEWLIEHCMHSYLKCEKVHLIPNGVDTDSFHVLNKQTVRQKYNIPNNKRILLFSAHNADSPYKGLKYLLSALEQLENNEKYYLLIIGDTEGLQFDTQIEILKLGYVKSEHTMNELYCAADLFILPSMADTFPLVSLEAMASGTPVLAFRTGGIAEAVEEEVGWCVRAGDSVELKNQIEYIFNNPQLLDYKTGKCREYIENNFSETIMLNKYKQLYDEIMSDKES